jgi:putative Holliday junction resolvase
MGDGGWEITTTADVDRRPPVTSAISHPPSDVLMRILAIDMGDRRIGLAISDPTGTIASPAGYITRRPGKRPPVTEMLERAKALEAEGFVVGLPLDQNGDETERSAEARHVAELLGTRSGLTVRLVDERFTTAAAQRAIREMGGSTRGRKGDVDALAATVLLQHALSFQEHQP